MATSSTSTIVPVEGVTNTESSTPSRSFGGHPFFRTLLSPHRLHSPSSPFAIPFPPSLSEVLSPNALASLTSTSTPAPPFTRLLSRDEAPTARLPLDFRRVGSPTGCPTVFVSRGTQDTLGSVSTGVSLGEEGHGDDSMSAHLAAAPWRSLIASVSQPSVEGRGSFQPLPGDRTFSVAAISSSSRSPVETTSSAFAAAFLSAQPPVEADAPIFTTTSSLPPSSVEAVDAVETSLVVSSSEGTTIAATAATPSLLPPPTEADDAVVTAPLVVSSLEGTTIAATAAQPSLPPPPTGTDGAATAAQPSLPPPPTEADDAVAAPLVASSSEGTTVAATAALHSLSPPPMEANDAVTAAQPSLPPLQTGADDAVAAPLVASSSEGTTVAATAVLHSLPPPPTEANDAVTAAQPSLPPLQTGADDAVAAPIVASSSEGTTVAATAALHSLPPPPTEAPPTEAVVAVEASTSVLPREEAVVAVPAALPSAPSPPTEAVVAVEASTSVLPREEAVVAVPAALPSAPSPPTEAVVAVEASTSVSPHEEAVVAVPAALPSAPSPPTEAVVAVEASPPISQRLLLWEESLGSTPRSVPAPIPSPSGGVASLGDQELPSQAPRSSLPAPPRRQATISMLDGSRRSMDSMSTPLSPGRGGGRAVGPARLSGFSGRDEDPQIAITYRHLVNELLLSPTVPLSGQDPEEDAGSEPDEADGVFLESVMALERHRPRPSSRGNSGRIGLFGPVPRSSTGMELGRIPQRSWDMVPRGAVSEWFPAMPESSEDQECLACQGEIRVLRELLRRRSESSRAFASRGDRGYESALGVLPLLDWSENRLRSMYSVGNHSCGCGRSVSMPIVLFTPSARQLPIADVRGQGVQLRLFLHLLLPGSPMSWVARAPFSGVFPLFGLIRRFWGRFVLIRGDLSFLGFPPRSCRHVLVRHSLSLSVRSRHRGVLRYAPLDVFVTSCYSARGDVFVYGASLQWEGCVSQGVEGDLRLPTEVTLNELRRSFRTRVAPHSFVTNSDGVWQLTLPNRPQETSPVAPVSPSPELASGEATRPAAASRTVAPARGSRRRRRVLFSAEEGDEEGEEEETMPVRRSRRRRRVLSSAEEGDNEEELCPPLRRSRRLA